MSEPRPAEREHVIVAILEVRRAELDAFRSFEARAAALMREHGGAIERTVVVDDGRSSAFKEIHFVRFASRAAFDAYRADPRLAAVQHLREVSVLSTQLHHGTDGPAYGPHP